MFQSNDIPCMTDGWMLGREIAGQMWCFNIPVWFLFTDKRASYKYTKTFWFYRHVNIFRVGSIFSLEIEKMLKIELNFRVWVNIDKTENVES